MIVQFDSDLNPVGTPISFSDPAAWRGIWGAALDEENGMGYFVSWTFSSNSKVAKASPPGIHSHPTMNHYISPIPTF